VTVASFYAILVTAPLAIKLTLVTYAMIDTASYIILASPATSPIATNVSKVIYVHYVLIFTLLKTEYVYYVYLRAKPATPMEAV
jgi:hypothetical protein